MAKVKNFIYLIDTRLCNVAMVTMFFLMCFTTVDVLLRKFVPAIGGITDSVDFTNYILVVLIFCGFAYLETQHGHIRVDVLVILFPKKVQNVLEGVMMIIAAVVLFFTAYAFFSTIASTIASHKGTTVMHFPQWPFELVAAIAILMYAVTVLFHGIFRLAEKAENAADSEELAKA